MNVFGHVLSSQAVQTIALNVQWIPSLDSMKKRKKKGVTKQDMFTALGEGMDLKKKKSSVIRGLPKSFIFCGEFFIVY